jgi:hypothetical protein
MAASGGGGGPGGGYTASLGRISGELLSPNLLRNGIDLAVESDLLYLKVSPQRQGTLPDREDGDPNYPGVTGTGIGINRDVPVYDLDVNSDISTTDLTITSQANIGDIILSTPNTISSATSPINVYIAGTTLFHDRLTTSVLSFDDNRISSFSNGNIVLDPATTGTIEWYANTLMEGNLDVTGNINVSGNLSSTSSLTIGDRTTDSLTLNTDFKQSIIPGIDNTFALGADAADSSPRRWAELHAPDWTTVGLFIPDTIRVSDQLLIDGINRKISGLQSNDDVVISPDTGITYIEQTKWQDNDITNLLNTPLTLASTGIGYLRVTNTNGMVIPSGVNADRRVSPEVGETRWNTEEAYLECFDGTVWTVSIGSGPTVTAADMQELSELYTLMLG